LFVGIDVSSKTNAVYAMDFEENKYISSVFGNNQPGTEELADMLAACIWKHKNLDMKKGAASSHSSYPISQTNYSILYLNTF
jgi:hypothetical protein